MINAFRWSSRFRIIKGVIIIIFSSSYAKRSESKVFTMPRLIDSPEPGTSRLNSTETIRNSSLSDSTNNTFSILSIPPNQVPEMIRKEVNRENLMRPVKKVRRKLLLDNIFLVITAVIYFIYVWYLSEKLIKLFMWKIIYIILSVYKLASVFSGECFLNSN